MCKRISKKHVPAKRIVVFYCTALSLIHLHLISYFVFACNNDFSIFGKCSTRYRIVYENKDNDSVKVLMMRQTKQSASMLTKRSDILFAKAKYIPLLEINGTLNFPGIPSYCCRLNSYLYHMWMLHYSTYHEFYNSIERRLVDQVSI